MDSAAQRALMVERDICARGVRDPRVLAALASVPCEAFLPPELAEFAYEDRPLPIEAGQTHYFQAILPAQFDEYIWFDDTTAVEPLLTGDAVVAPDAEHPFSP